jgi:hypothetical protein
MSPKKLGGGDSNISGGWGTPATRPHPMHMYALLPPTPILVQRKKLSTLNFAVGLGITLSPIHSFYSGQSKKLTFSLI